MKYLTALCGIGNEDLRYIDEWREWHKALGVEEFVWGVHRVIDDTDFTKRYGDRQLRLKIDYTGGHQEEIRCMGLSYDMIKSCRGSRWLLWIDNDEFIVCDKPLTEFLVEFERHQALGINWLMFGSSGYETKQFPQTEAYHWRTKASRGAANSPQAGNWHVKSVFDPSAVHRIPGDPHYMGVETVNENHQRISSPFSRFNGNRIRINHYWTRSLEDWQEKMRYSVSPRTMQHFNDFNAACVINDPTPTRIHGYENE